MFNPNLPGQHSDEPVPFSYEHVIALGDTDEGAMSPKDDTPDVVDVTIQDTSALWGELFSPQGVDSLAEGMLPDLVRGKHIRRAE